MMNNQLIFFIAGSLILSAVLGVFLNLVADFMKPYFQKAKWIAWLLTVISLVLSIYFSVRTNFPEISTLPKTTNTPISDGFQTMPPKISAGTVMPDTQTPSVTPTFLSTHTPTLLPTGTFTAIPTRTPTQTPRPLPTRTRTATPTQTSVPVATIAPTSGGSGQACYRDAYDSNNVPIKEPCTCGTPGCP